MAEGKDPINGYNEACNNTSLGYLKVVNKSTSAIRFWTTVKGDLPHLSYIFSIHNHWVNSSSLWYVILLGNFYS